MDKNFPSSSDSAFDSSSQHSADERGSNYWSERGYGDNSNNNGDGFVMKNGCCRDCMKAFSKNGKVSVSFSNILELPVLSSQIREKIYTPIIRL